MTFAEHKEITAKDCEEIAKHLTELAKIVREGNMDAFEKYWIEGGTEEGDANIFSTRELIIMRYAYRMEQVK